MKSLSEKQAKKTITSLMQFYLDVDIIEKDEYLQAKKKMDEMTMGSLVYQLKAGERALTTLLETIEGGELAPRMFEVLATLQKSMLDIIKSQTMYLMATEESAKRIARDIELYKKRDDDDAITETGSGSSTNIQRGTKDLMNQIQAGIQQADIEDIEPEPEDER
jgi:gas vesicle protein